MRNSEIRRHLLDYDDVMNRQREVVYNLRNSILQQTDPRPVYDDLSSGHVQALVERTVAAGKYPDEWDWDGLRQELQFTFLADIQVGPEERRRVDAEDLSKMLTDIASRRYDERREELGGELLADLCRFVFLRTIDCPLARPPVRAGHGARGHFAARLRPEGPAGRVQAGVVPDVR